MKSNITLETFESIIIEQLKERGCNTKIVETPEKLGPEHRLIKEPCKDRLTTAIKIEEIYNDYAKNLASEHPASIDNVVNDIIEIFNIKPPVNDVSILTMIKSWNEAKDRLFVAIYNKNRHAEYLNGNVHTCIEDLAITPRLLIRNFEDGDVMSTMISQELLKSWGKTKEEIIAEALKMAPVIMPIEIHNMGNLVKETFSNIKNQKGFDSDMIVVTTKGNITGASLFYDGVLEKFANQFDGFFYIFPSSIYEFIIVSGKRCPYPEELLHMVCDVDANVASPDCVLSDHAYVYRNGKIGSL